mgnify:CR=1 FL=1
MNTEEFKNKVIPFARKLYPMMKQYLKNEEDTKDALQELMLRLWNRRDELETMRSTNSYMVTMAKNYCLDALKKKKLMPLNEKDRKIMEIPIGDPGYETREKSERIRSIIGNLPEKYREVIKLRDIDGFSFEEITSLTGIEAPHLRVILSRSRLKVREELLKVYSYEKGTYIGTAQEIL